MTRYVTLAYGKDRGVYRQSVMLLVSLVAFAAEPYELVVATDRPECYVWFGTRVDIQYLDASLLRAWRGPEPFSMPQKLLLLRAAWPESGAIVLPAADRALLDEAIALYDEMGRRGFRHFAAEQLAEGLVFGPTGRLRAAEPWFAHYWGNRAGYDPEIACRLSEAFLEGMSVKEAAAAYRGRPIDLPQEVRPTRAQKIRRWLTA